MTVSCRRSASPGGTAGGVSAEVSGGGTAAAGAARPARRAVMAGRSRLRGTSEVTPSSRSSPAVSSGRTPSSTSLSRNACSYWPKPSPRSQAPTSIPIPPDRACSPSRCSLSRAAVECAMERHERAAFRSSPIAGRELRVAFDGGRLTSDAGVLPLADIERRLGIAERLARCIADPRAPDRVHHTVAEMIRFRVLLIAAGYPDANDCDTLRSDPAFKMALGRPPESGRHLCLQPTMCRLENLPTITALKRM